MAAQRPTARCSTEGLSRAEVIVLLFQAFRTMKWGVAHLHPMRVVAITPRSAFSYGEEVVVDLDHEGFTAVSKFQQWTFVSGRKRHQRNLDALMDAFAEARVSTTPEIMAAELKELDESGAMQQDAATAHANEFHWRDIGSMFIPRREFFSTPMLIDASVLVFIAMVASGVHVLSPTGADLLEWGANHRPYTLDGQWWRLLTCCFVHIGVFHLLLNMYALLMIGLHLEPLLGRWHIFALYGITGVFASLASLWWHDNTVSAGASGAIFGLYGVFLALLFTDLFHKDVRQNLLQSIGIFVVYNLIYGLKGGVDNAAHIGGLASGLALGGGLYFALKKPEHPGLHLAAWGAPLLVLGVCSGLVLRSIPVDDALFQKEITAFQVLEEKGLAPFKMPDVATANAQLILVQDSGLPAWREAVELMRRSDTLELSHEMARQRDLFTVYAEARLHTMELVEAALLKGVSEPDAEMQASFARIDSILSLINVE